MREFGISLDIDMYDEDIESRSLLLDTYSCQQSKHKPHSTAFKEGKIVLPISNLNARGHTALNFTQASIPEIANTKPDHNKVAIISRSINNLGTSMDIEDIAYGIIMLPNTNQ